MAMTRDMCQLSGTAFSSQHNLQNSVAHVAAGPAVQKSAFQNSAGTLSKPHARLFLRRFAALLTSTSVMGPQFTGSSSPRCSSNRCAVTGRTAHCTLSKYSAMVSALCSELAMLPAASFNLPCCGLGFVLSFRIRVQSPVAARSSNHLRRSARADDRMRLL